MKKHSKNKLKKRLRKAKKKALRQQMSLADVMQKAEMHPIEMQPVLELPEQEMIPVLEGYDETTLARAKTHWFFGEWYQLAALDMDSLRVHPDRDRFALLIASAHQQLGEHDKARKYTRMALDWGCPPRVVAQVLIAGVHNTLGRAAALKQDKTRIAQHFERSVAAIGTRDTALVSHARSVREMARMGLLPQAVSLVDKELQADMCSAQRPELERTRLQVLESEMTLLRQEITLTQQYTGKNSFEAQLTDPTVPSASERLISLADECVKSDDVLEKIDECLLDDLSSREEKFQLCILLCEHFFHAKDNLQAQHFIFSAQDYLSDDFVVSNQQRLLLSRKLLALGRGNDALDLAIQKIVLDRGLTDQERSELLASYEKIRAVSKARGEHGHRVLLDYLLNNYLGSVRQQTGKQSVLIEIGSTRENVPDQGSTRQLAEFCSSAGLDFITVDMDPHCTASAKQDFESLGENLQAINMKGEDYLREYVGEFDFVFLDAYDFDHGKHSSLRQSRYKKFLGNKIDEQECHRMHLDCAKSIVKKLSPSGVVCIDDTWTDDNGRWCAKGTLAVPYFLENGFQLLEARNRAVLLKRKADNA